MKVINGIKLYTMTDLCSMLEVGEATIRRYRKEGLIASITIGKRPYVTEQALKDFLRGKTQEAAKRRKTAEEEAQ